MTNRLAKLTPLLLIVICASAYGQDKSGKEDDCKLPELRDELTERVKIDQQIRRQYMELVGGGEKTGGGKEGESENDDSKNKATLSLLMGKMTRVDRENTAWLKEQVEQHGWLGKTLVGEGGAQNAWLLVQHADRDPEFQKHCLDLMNKMPDGEVSKKNVAYLTDRVLCADNKPQRFGTQVTVDPTTGKPKVKEVEDPDNLNKRRASVGLGTIEEYLKLFEQDK